MVWVPVASADEVAEVLQADDARIAAMRAADRAALEAVFADDLHYAHSNGVVDTKASFLQVLTSGTTKYLAIEPEQRQVKLVAPGVALVSGRARIQAESKGTQMDAVLSYLAVWRLENGTWRFLAWQSCRLPPAQP